ncbi:gluconokinase [Streptomyces sp. NPDC051561]|uniref:gluconokinase n=1 Tax=Streptomyces sp. NPDC051561 TaxID=3365658 RepID=UPI00378C49A3
MNFSHVVIVMGVAGTGKSIIGALLAEKVGVPYAEGDDLHPAANVAKMASGVPLSDEDRWPWLDLVGEWARGRAGSGGVVTCSALRRVYRDRLREAAPGVAFVHLAGERALIEGRMRERGGHFMPVALLDSQFALLEGLGEDEAGVTVGVEGSPGEIVERAVGALREC